MNLSVQQQRNATGHTLLELVLSLVLLSIIFASVGSAVMFAASASPGEDSVEATMATDSRVISQIAEDLAVAKYIVEKSDHAVTIVVADRTGDGIPDRIRYAWSGTDGKPLTYQINDEDEIHLIESVAAFRLAYTVETRSKALPVAAYLGDERTIDSYTSKTWGDDVPVNATSRVGQTIVTNLTSDAMGFLPTRLDLFVTRIWTKDGETQVNLQAWTGSAPDESVFARSTIYESVLSDTTPGWHTLTFSDVAIAPKQQALALTATYAGGSSHTVGLRSADVSGGLLGLGAGRGGQLASSDGVTWSEDGDATLVYRLYGRELLRDDQQYTVLHEQHTTTSVSLQSVAKNRSPLKRKVRMLLAPPVLDDFAETEFDADPTAMDLDGDSRPDWSHGSGTFPPDSLSSGVWTADGTLVFESDHLSSAQVISLTARMQSNDTLGPTIYGPYTVDSQGKGLPIITQLRQDDQGGQELVIYNGFSLATPYITIPDLPAGLVDIQITVIPDADLLCIEVNHQVVACLLLQRVDDPGTISQPVWITSSGGVAKFGSAYIRVGGSYAEDSDSDSDSDDGGLIPGLLDLLF